ncbi:hypothetical protein QYE76_052580 [Lolium multiflorum]|uniref:Retrotransposon gag domain-containing protein n=1 Tax=Lolium multiflorum TaxID=4521 RepID=A0AAD8WJL9_LOLMU|nr:hypothetical protein QYE76_052580 [Lolium multiflorum]
MGQVESTSATICHHLETGTGSARRSHAGAGTKTASLSLVGTKTASQSLAEAKDASLNPEGAGTKSARLSPAGAETTEATTTKRKGATEAGASRGKSGNLKAEEHLTGFLVDLLATTQWRRGGGGGARVWLSDLEENTIFCWFDLKKAFENHFRGTYKRPATTSDLQACIQKKGETSRSFLTRWLATRNKCENVDNHTTMHAFIGGLQRGGLLRHKLTFLVNANKLTLDEMINIASDHTAADDDTGGDLAATTIPLHQQKKNRDNGVSNINKRKNPSEDQKGGGSDMVAMTFQRGGPGGGRGHGCGGGAGRGQQRADEVTAAGSRAPQTIQASPEAPPTRQRRQGQEQGKEEDSSEAMDEDDASPDPKEGAAANKSNPFGKKSVGAYHTFLGTPTVRAKKSALRLLNATVPAVPQYVKWSEKACTFDRSDHPAVIPKECYALVVSPRIDGFDFSKCLWMALAEHHVHGDSGEDERPPTKSSTPACYIYNKLKIPGPNGMITVSGDYKKARDCEEGEAAFAESVISRAARLQSRGGSDEMQTTKKQISEDFVQGRDRNQEA